jgi:hypothetical protein
VAEKVAAGRPRFSFPFEIEKDADNLRHCPSPVAAAGVSAASKFVIPSVAELCAFPKRNCPRESLPSAPKTAKKDN